MAWRSGSHAEDKHLPENNTSARGPQHSRLPISVIDRVEISLERGDELTDTETDKLNHLSVMQLPNAFTIILAASSMDSLFCPLYLAWKSA